MTVDAPLLRGLFDTLGAGMYALDGEGRFVATNPMMGRLLGYAEPDLLGRHAHATIHRHAYEPIQLRRPDGSADPTVECPLLGVLQDGRPAESNDDVFVRSDGSTLPVSWVSAPVLVAGKVGGAVCVFFDATERRRQRQERGEQVERERLARVESERAYARLTLLNEVSEAMTGVLEVPEALRRLARIVVPEFADWCVVDLRAEDGTVARVAVVHRDQGVVPAGRFEGSLGQLPSTERSLLSRVLSGAGPVYLTDIDQAGPMDTMTRVQQDMFTELGADSAIIVPLQARGGTLGALTLVRADPARALDRQDVLLAAELGRRAGLMVDNARLYSEQRRMVETLQRSLLTEPPQLADVSIEARYLPANDAAEVGGDWYDAFVLPDEALVLVIGDVVGHDVHAAARMAQLRSILRAVAYQMGEPPAAILRYVDRIVQGLDVAELATAIYALLEREPDGSYVLNWASAGHPDPLLAVAGEAAELLTGGEGLLLGVADDAERSSGYRRLPSGATVVLYTDGLVENRHERLDTGLARLRLAATSLADRPLPEFCDELIERLVGRGTTDDVALIAIRIP